MSSPMPRDVEDIIFDLGRNAALRIRREDLQEKARSLGVPELYARTIKTYDELSGEYILRSGNSLYRILPLPDIDSRSKFV